MVNHVYTDCLNINVLSDISALSNIYALLYPRYKAYRGYIVFAFSVIMFVCLFVCLSVCLLTFFSVKDFSATTGVRILKFGTKLDSDELYCVAKTATYCLSVPLFVHFSFSPLEISVTDFSVPIGASVLKKFVHLQVGSVLCKWKLRC